MIKDDIEVFIILFLTASYHMAINADGCLGKFLGIISDVYKFSFVII